MYSNKKNENFSLQRCQSKFFQDISKSASFGGGFHSIGAGGILIVFTEKAVC